MVGCFQTNGRTKSASCLAVNGGCHAVLGLKVASESVGTRETAGKGNLRSGQVGLVIHQVHGKLKAKLTKVAVQSVIATAS